MANARVRRGRKAQEIVAERLRQAGFPNAESASASLPGADILGIPGLQVEVKARREFEPMAWLKQACKRRDKGMPSVVWQPDGYGPERVDDWPVMLTVREWVELLQSHYDIPTYQEL